VTAEDAVLDLMDDAVGWSTPELHAKAVRALEPVQKMSVWVPMTAEAILDSAYLRATVEYHMFAGRAALTLRERLTGYRHFTSSQGFRLTLYVGWRARWRAFMESLARPIWRDRTADVDVLRDDDDPLGDLW
jgi:hypothetical protein